MAKTLDDLVHEWTNDDGEKHWSVALWEDHKNQFTWPLTPGQKQNNSLLYNHASGGHGYKRSDWRFASRRAAEACARKIYAHLLGELRFSVRVETTRLIGAYETMAEAAEAAIKSGHTHGGDTPVVVYDSDGGRAFEGRLDDLLAEVGLEA